MSIRFWNMKYEGSFVQHPVKGEWMKVMALSLKGSEDVVADHHLLPEKSIGRVTMKLMNEAGDYFKAHLKDIENVPPPESYRICDGQLAWCGRTMEKQYKLGVHGNLWQVTGNTSLIKWLNTPAPVHSKPEELFTSDSLPLVFSDQLALSQRGDRVMYQNKAIYDVHHGVGSIRVTEVQGARIPSFISYWDKYLGITYQWAGTSVSSSLPETGLDFSRQCSLDYHWTPVDDIERINYDDFRVHFNNVTGVLSVCVDTSDGDYELSAASDIDRLRDEEEYGEEIIEDLYTMFDHSRQYIVPPELPEIVGPQAPIVLVDGMPPVISGPATSAPIPVPPESIARPNSFPSFFAPRENGLDRLRGSRRSAPMPEAMAQAIGLDEIDRLALAQAGGWQEARGVGNVPPVYQVLGVDVEPDAPVPPVARRGDFF